MKIATNEIILIIMSVILLGAIISYVYNWNAAPENSVSGSSEEVKSFLEQKSIECYNRFYGYPENVDCYVVDVNSDEPINSIKSSDVNINIEEEIPSGHSKVKVQYDAVRECINLVVI